MTKKQNLEEKMKLLYLALPEADVPGFRYIDEKMFIKALTSFVKIGELQMLSEMKDNIDEKIKQL